MNRNGQQKVPTLEDVKRIIQPLLVTVKGDISSVELERDYKTMEGPIPYRQLGFASVDELLKSMPDILSYSYVNGSLRVRALLKDETKHIQALVRGQKSSGKRSNRGGRGGFGSQRLPSQPSAPRNPSLAAPTQRGGNLPRASQSYQIGNGIHYYRPPALRSQAPGQNVAIRQSMQPSYPAPSMTTSVTISASRPTNLQIPQPSLSSTKPTLSLPLNNVRTSRDRLRRLVEYRQLGKETYTSTKVKSRKFVGCVEVEKKKYSCYPNEFNTEEEAFEEAARLALEELEEKFKGKDARKLPTTTDSRVMTFRILEMVKKFATGCWSEAFPQQYEDEYGESLPENWVQLVQRMTNELEFTPVGDYFTICIKKTVKIEEVPKQMAGMVHVEHSVSELFDKPLIDKPLSSDSTKQPFTPSSASPETPQELDELDAWIKVQVTVIHKGGQLGVRRTDTECYDAWEALMTDMEVYYNEYQAKMQPVRENMQLGRLYAACVDSIWLRVQLLEYSPNKDTVDVALVDYGDMETISAATVYPLESRFAAAPHQGMLCSLYGLAPFASSAVAYNTAVKLLESVYDARVMSFKPVSVVLYDPNTGADMNEWLLSQVAEDMAMEPLRPGGPADKGVCTVSYVSSACDVYLRRDIPLTALVDSMVSLVALRAEAGLLHPVTGLSPDGVYLGYNDQHGWCRMNPLSAVPSKDGNVPVMLMDYGDLDVVPSDSLRPLAVASPILARLPGQAVRVSLARVPPSPTKTFTPQAAKKLREIAPPDSGLIMRVVDMARNGLPVVELFERLPSGKVAMVNASLELDESLYRSTDEMKKADPSSFAPETLKLRKLSSSTSPLPDGGTFSDLPEADLRHRIDAVKLGKKTSTGNSNGSTPSPTPQYATVPEAILPEVSQKNLDVKICNVSGPHHFYVQPLSTFIALTQLTEQLKRSSPKPVDRAAVVEGGYYAVLHNTSQQFRRVRVIRKFGGDVQIHHVDFGETDVIPIDQLRVLSPEFGDLPAQAIRAQLHGVKATDVDWSPQNVLFFKKCVDQKALTCTVMGHLQGKSLSLQLFDLRGRNEISVAQLMIDQCHASPV